MWRYFLATVAYLLFMLASFIGIISSITIMLDEEAIMTGTLGIGHYVSFIIAFLVIFTLSFVGVSRSILRLITYKKESK
jgi:TRAP-type C4-dicarboxylate transport system permease small subunit